MGTTPGEDHRLPPEGDERSTWTALDLVRRLAQDGRNPDKSLGQHFLVSDRVVRQILEASSGFAGVLEVGPGPGVLTLPLSLRGSVTSLELDPRMAAASQAAAPAAKIIQADALQADWSSFLRELPEPRGIVSNMPYNITGPLLGKVAEQAGEIAGATLMMQREVGDKILAPAGDRNRGFLSVWLQAVFTIRRVCLVPPGCFSPPPKVESIVLSLTPTGENPSSRLLGRVKMGFRQPRKTLANNLGGSVSEIISLEGLSASIRPHQMTWEQWRDLDERLGP